jgi:hypothetical protein
MAREADSQEKVTLFSTAHAGFALTRETNALTFVNASGNFHLISLDFVRVAPTQRNLSRRTTKRFLERDHDVRFDILPALDRSRSLTESAESRLAAAGPKERFEEVAESRAAKLELDSTAIATGASAKAAASVASPTRRRLKTARLIPIGAELIVLGTLLGITQDFVGFVDLFEFFLGLGFLPGLGEIGMMFPGELAESALDFICARRLAHA